MNAAQSVAPIRVVTPCYSCASSAGLNERNP